MRGCARRGSAAFFLHEALPQQEPAPLRTLKGPLDYITDEYREFVDGYGDDLDNEEDLS